MLLNILQCTGQLPTTKRYPAQVPVQLQCAEGEKPWTRGTVHDLLLTHFSPAHTQPIGTSGSSGSQGGSMEVLTILSLVEKYSKEVFDPGAM